MNQDQLPTNQNQSQPHKSHLHKGLLAVVILTVIAVAVGYIYAQKEKPVVENNAVQTTNQTQPSLPEITGQPQTQQWTVYTNDALGFKIQYPADQIVPSRNNITANNSTYVTITIASSSNTTSLSITGISTNSTAKNLAQKIWNLNKNDTNPNVRKTVSNIKQFSIGSTPAYTFDVSGSFEDENGGMLLEDGTHTYIYFDNGGRVTQVNYPSSVSLLKDIAATIQIVPRPDSSWNTYTGNGFTFKYPNSESQSFTVLDQAPENNPVATNFGADDVEGYLWPTTDPKKLTVSFPDQNTKSGYTTLFFTSTTGDSTELDTFRQIAASFNFELSKNVSTWQKFSKNGVSISYPKNLFPVTEQNKNSLFTGSGSLGIMDVSLTNTPFDPNSIKGIYGTYSANKLQAYKVGMYTGYAVNEGDAGCSAQNISAAVNNKTLTISFTKCEDYNLDLQPDNLLSDESLKTSILSTVTFNEN